MTLQLQLGEFHLANGSLNILTSIHEGSTEGVWRKGVNQNRLDEVKASNIHSTKFYEGFWDLVAVSFPSGPPFHETSTNSPGSKNVFFAKLFLCTLPSASESNATSLD